MTDNIENLEQEENVKDKKMAEYIEEIEEGELEDEEEKIVYSKSIHPNSKENVETAEVISIESSEEGELRVEVEDGEIQEDSEPEWDAVKVGTIDVVKFKLINEKQNVHNSEVGERGWYEKEIDRIKQRDGVHPIKQAKEHFRRKNLREKLLRMKKEKERIQGGGKKLDLVQDSRPFMAEISERNGNVDITGERIDEFLKGVVENNVEEERSELEDSSEVDMEMSDDSAGNEEIDNKIIVQRNKLNSQEIMKRIEAMRKTKEMSSKLIVEQGNGRGNGKWIFWRFGGDRGYYGQQNERKFESD
ncbi:hypothetical protein AX774_g2367 [Zancudomyces culisetae]|uniref:Uncharacterized protein n=1 Tax=Zancudomyces culisetae TaxID=1213189 RepID=A0A1R1PSZ1_ZANCU|nr:hypothetical protein AX774_g2367 [Zancudomyces culisetae]|eukprot:OMH84116.1 hypothetical protein AX774_g2367 [Zancudomyces culisetae]